MCFLQHHVSCESHPRSQYIFLDHKTFPPSMRWIAFLMSCPAAASPNIFDGGITQRIYRGHMGTVAWDEAQRLASLVQCETLGDIQREIGACYLSEVAFRKWFDEKGKKPVRRALENRWCSAANAATRNAFSKKGSTTRVETSTKTKKGQTKMRRSSSVANTWLVLSTWHTKKILRTAMCNGCCSKGTQ